MRSLPKIQRCQSEPTLGRDYMQSAADSSDFAFTAPPVTSPRTPLNTQQWASMFPVPHKISTWLVSRAWQTVAPGWRCRRDPTAGCCKYIFRTDPSAFYSYLPDVSTDVDDRLFVPSHGILLLDIDTAMYMHVWYRTSLVLTSAIPTVVAVSRTLLVAFQLVISADVDDDRCWKPFCTSDLHSTQWQRAVLCHFLQSPN